MYMDWMVCCNKDVNSLKKKKKANTRLTSIIEPGAKFRNHYNLGYRVAMIFFFSVLSWFSFQGLYRPSIVLSTICH